MTLWAAIARSVGDDLNDRYGDGSPGRTGCLAGPESAACGCAVIMADYDASIDRAQNGIGIVYKAGDIDDLSKKIDLRIVIFSPIFAIKFTKLSFTKIPLVILVSFNLSKLPFVAKLMFEISLQKFIKS